jgi:hypothetical protein
VKERMGSCRLFKGIVHDVGVSVWNDVVTLKKLD